MKERQKVQSYRDILSEKVLMRKLCARFLGSFFPFFLGTRNEPMALAQASALPLSYPPSSQQFLFEKDCVKWELGEGFVLLAEKLTSGSQCSVM